MQLPPNLQTLMEKEEINIMEEIIKNRTEFDTFMLEKRIDDLQRLTS